MNVYVFWLLNVAFFFQSECTLAWEAVWNQECFYVGFLVSFEEGEVIAV